MKKLRAGMVAVLIAIMSAVGVVASSTAAHALDGWDPNKPPPRVAPPPNTTTTVTNKPLTKPQIPPGILGTAAKFLGLAGLGYSIGALLRPMICGDGPDTSGKFTICPTAPPADTSGLLPVDPVPDKVWCVFNGGCADNPENFDVGIVPAAPANANYGLYSYSITGLSGTSAPLMSRTYAQGPKCSNVPSVCATATTNVQSPIELRGSCRNPATGLAYGLITTNATPATWNPANLTANGGTTSERKMQFQNQTRTATDGPICPLDYTLEWLVWRDAGGTNFQGTPGFWRNPAVATDLGTVITSNLTCAYTNNPASTVTVTKSTPKSSGLVAQLQCPYGTTPVKGNTSIANDLLTAPKKIDEWEILPPIREQYPDCIGWQSAGCKLMVFLDGVECTPAIPACRNWEEIERYQPSRLKCKWGPYVLDMSMCRVLRQAYIGETGTVSNPNNDPKAAPIAVDPWGKPLPQNPDPAVPAPVPGTTPGTTPSTGPTTGTNPNPGPADIPKYNPDPNTPPSDLPGPGPTLTPGPSDTNCWPGGTAAFNPLEWVLQPVKCALSWAFVPKQSTMQNQVTRVQNSVGKVGVVGAIGTIGTTINTVGTAAGGSGCSGPSINFDFGDVHQAMTPFNACSEPVATMATISRAFTTVVVIVLGTLGMARAAGAAVGFNFTMGRGGA